MGIKSKIKSFFSKKKQITVSEEAPQNLEPVKAIDYINRKGTGGGSIVVSGQTVFDRPGISGGKVRTSSFSKSTTEEILNADSTPAPSTGYTETLPITSDVMTRYKPTPKKETGTRAYEKKLFEKGVTEINPNETRLNKIDQFVLKKTNRLNKDGLEYDFSNYMRGLSRSGYFYARANPRTVALNTGFAFAGGGLLSGGGSLLTRYGSPFVVKVASITGKAVGSVAVGLYTGYKGVQISRQPDSYSKGQKTGDIIAGEIVPGVIGGYAGVKSFQMGQGYARTFGRTFVEPKDVIAPEYFKGEIYPSIKRGQTPQQLKQEFMVQVLPGEKSGVPRMFTSSPRPFKKETYVEKGTSELPGLYGSPKDSPIFLRLSGGSSKPFGIPNYLQSTPIPTIARTTMQGGLKLTPSLNPSQKSLGSLKTAKTFFSQDAKQGTAYIPFIKSEKEAILTEGTKLINTRGKYYTKFEGVRVPIDEQIALTKGGKIKNLNKDTKQNYYSSYKPPSYSSFDSGITLISSSITGSPGGTAYKPSTPYRPSRPTTPSIPSSPPSIPRPTYSYPPFKPPTSRFTFSGFKEGLGIRRLNSRKQQKGYTPSFSAIAFGLKGRKSKGVETGFNFRPFRIFSRKNKKRKK